jgi:hypothetical protein
VESFTASHKNCPWKIFSKGKEKKPRKENFLTGEWKEMRIPPHRAPYNSSKKLIKIDSGRVEKLFFTKPPHKALGNLFERKEKKPRKTNFLQASGGMKSPHRALNILRKR